MNLSLSGNEQDWKADLSDDMERLISFANHPNNGYLVSVDQEQVEGIIAKLTNIGRDERRRSNFSS